VKLSVIAPSWPMVRSSRPSQLTGNGEGVLGAGSAPACMASNHRRNSGMVPICATRWWSAVCSWLRTNSPAKISVPHPQPQENLDDHRL